MKRLPALLCLLMLFGGIHAQSGQATNSAAANCMQPGWESAVDAIVESLRPGTNYGDYLDCDAFGWTINGAIDTVRALLWFPGIASYAPGTPIQNATLFLYNNPTSNNLPGHSQLSGSNAAVLTRITTTWDESTVTWDTQPATTSPSSPLLTDAVPVPMSSSPNQDYVLDITQMAQEMIDNPGTNHGFMLQLQDEAHYRALIFASGDHPNPLLHPKLCITLDSNALDTPDPAVAAQVQVFPNPADNAFTVQFGAARKGRVLEFWNAQGQRLWLKNAGEASMEVECGDLPAGIYLLRVMENGHALYARRVVVR